MVELSALGREAPVCGGGNTGWAAAMPLTYAYLNTDLNVVNVLTVTIMRKETFFIHLDSEAARDQLLRDIIDCIEFASSGMSGN